jgi:hypothetical protein
MKRQNPQNDGINVSGISNSSINISGGDIHHVRTNINTGSGDISAVQQSFTRLYKALETLPEGLEKDEARGTIGKLEEEAQKGDRADENRVSRWMNFLAETAPDVWQVAVETFLNPIAGVSLVFKKVAERARKSSR